MHNQKRFIINQKLNLSIIIKEKIKLNINCCFFRKRWKRNEAAVAFWSIKINRMVKIENIITVINNKHRYRAANNFQISKCWKIFKYSIVFNY
jgi:hypothetical protein